MHSVPYASGGRGPPPWLLHSCYLRYNLSMDKQAITQHKPESSAYGYSDRFVAASLLLLKTNGWPDKRGALKNTAAALEIPYNTLSEWSRGKRRANVHGSRTRDIVKSELADMFQEGAQTLYADGMERRHELSAMQAITASAISVDKLQILTAGPSPNVQINVIASMGGAPTPWIEGEVVKSEGDI